MDVSSNLYIWCVKWPLHFLKNHKYTLPWMHRKQHTHREVESTDSYLAFASHRHCGIMVRLRPKFFGSSSSASGPTRSHSILPPRASPRHIGGAIVVCGLVSAAPLHAVPPLPAFFERAPEDDMDFSRAKAALRVLAALGDGVVGVPWLKGTAGLGLEIVNVLDVSGRNKWCRCNI